MNVVLPNQVWMVNAGTRCDMLVGACACGATHDIDELAKRIKDNLPDISDRERIIIGRHIRAYYDRALGL